MGNYVVFEYLYRDASNYKIYGALLFEGIITENVINFINSHFDCGTFFIPEAIGIPELRSQLFIYGGPNSDDHEFHEIVCIRKANTDDLAQLKPYGTFKDLLARIEKMYKTWMS